MPGRHGEFIKRRPSAPERFFGVEATGRTTALEAARVALRCL